jgi:hypothetical protein
MTDPVIIDTIEVTDATDFDQVVHDALAGKGGFGSHKYDIAPLDWVLRAYRQVRGTPVADRIGRGVATNLTDEDPAIRSQAIMFFPDFPEAAGIERLTDLVAGDRSLFADIPDPYHTSVDLEASLLMAFNILLVRGGRREIELARAEVLRPTHAWPNIRALIEVDADWVDEHAEEITRGTPHTGVLIVVGLAELGFDPVALTRRIAPLCPRHDRWAGYLEPLVDDPSVRDRILAAWAEAHPWPWEAP